MSKKHRPGQIYVHNGHFYRIAKRHNGCQGCIIEGSIFCPGVKVRGAPKKLECELENIILHKF